MTLCLLPAACHLHPLFPFLQGDADFAQFQRAFGIMQARRIMHMDGANVSALTADDIDLSRAAPMPSGPVSGSSFRVASTGKPKEASDATFVQVGPSSGGPAEV